jgi:SnoaL-like domain
MSSSYPHKLPSLTPREAITDALYRALIGFDRHDIPIFTSAFAGEDVTFEIHDGSNEPRTVNGLSTIQNTVLAQVGPMDTTHMISNVRVDVKDGADTASLTAYALAQHCPPGRGKEPDGPKFLAGAEYMIDLVRDGEDGLWKIKKWVLDVVWRQGDRAVIERD